MLHFVHIIITQYQINRQKKNLQRLTQMNETLQIRSKRQRTIATDLADSARRLVMD